MASNGESEYGGDGCLSLQPRLENRKLEILDTRFVKPLSPTPKENRWMPFTNLDLFWLTFYTPVLCVYENQEVGAKLLRDSLERALVEFYPLAGRVLTLSGEAPRVVCDDTGAVFVEARIDAELGELRWEDDGLQPSFVLTGMAQAGLGQYPRLPDGPDGRPALVVQLTHFRCGGTTLASNWAHGVADGYSGFHFMKSWAELARGDAISLRPFHNRALIQPRNPLILSDPFSESYRPDSSTLKPGTLPPEPIPSKVTVQVVEIPAQLIAELKQEGARANPEARLSTVSYVSAHLWRAITKARELRGTDSVRMWTLIEGRKQLALPAGYFGNIIGFQYATTTVNDLLNKPLAYSASLVAKSIQQTTKDWYQNLVDWLEAKRSVPHPGEVHWQDHECGTSWQNRFPYYELDFGFGPPAKSIRNASAAWDGSFVILPSSRSPHNFTAMVHTTPDVMARFLPLLHRFSS